MNKKISGFTLIELMITIAIIGLLSALVVPAYNAYVQRSKLSQSFTELSDLRLQMEQFYRDNRTYGDGAGNCGIADTNTAFFNYTCTFDFDAGNGITEEYRWTATNIAGNGLGNAGDFVYTILNDGTQQTTKYEGAEVNQTCWKNGSSAC